MSRHKRARKLFNIATALGQRAEQINTPEVWQQTLEMTQGAIEDFFLQTDPIVVGPSITGLPDPVPHDNLGEWFKVFYEVFDKQLAVVVQESAGDPDDQDYCNVVAQFYADLRQLQDLWEGTDAGTS